jgi:hypothetical protein
MGGWRPRIGLILKAWKIYNREGSEDGGER